MYKKESPYKLMRERRESTERYIERLRGNINNIKHMTPTILKAQHIIDLWLEEEKHSTRGAAIIVETHSVQVLLKFGKDDDIPKAYLFKENCFDYATDISVEGEEPEFRYKNIYISFDIEKSTHCRFVAITVMRKETKRKVVCL